MKRKRSINLTNSAGVVFSIPASDIAIVKADGNGVDVEDVDGNVVEYSESYSYVKKLLARVTERTFIEIVRDTNHYVNMNHIVYVKGDSSDLAIVEMKDSGTISTSEELYTHLQRRISNLKHTMLSFDEADGDTYYVNADNINSINGLGDPFVTVMVVANGETLTANTELRDYTLKRLASLGYRTFAVGETITGFGDVTFTVVDPANSDAAIEDVDVTFADNTISTDASGVAVFNNVNYGSALPYVAAKEGWVELSGTITVDGAESEDVDLVGLSVVTVTVEDGGATPIEGANVSTTADSETLSNTTEVDGTAEIEDVHFDNSGNVAVTADGYVDSLTNALDVNTAAETATVTLVSTQTELTSYSFTEGTAVIDSDLHTASVEVANGTTVTGLVATFTLSYGASATVSTVAQVSGTTANDFTTAVTYVVTAEDATTTQDWVVTVTELAA